MDNKTPKYFEALGTKYKIVFKTEDEDSFLIENAGFTDFANKQIVLNSGNIEEDVTDTKYRRVLRHEVIHAFLYESGLNDSYCWDEESTVDWFAIQSPKIFKVYEELDINDI